MAITTTSIFDAPVNRVYSRRALSRAKAACVYFSGSQPGDVMQSNSGTFTMLWRRYENLTPTTSALSELTGSVSFPTRTATSLSKADVTATVSKYGDYVALSEEVNLQEYTNLNAEVSEVMGIQGGRSLNRLQRNILEDNLTVVYEGGGSADSSVTAIISRNSIRFVTNTLNRNDAMKFAGQTTGSQNVGTTPIRSAYLAFCHSDVEEDVRLLAGFVAAEQYASQTQLFPEEFGAVGGVRFCSSSEATIDANSGGIPGAGVRSTAGAAVDLYSTVIIGMECHGALSLDVELIRETYTAGDMIPGLQLISKPAGSAGAADPLNELNTVGWKAWHGGAIKNSTWGRVVRTAASRLN